MGSHGVGCDGPSQGSFTVFYIKRLELLLLILTYIYIYIKKKCPEIFRVGLKIWAIWESG